VTSSLAVFEGTKINVYDKIVIENQIKKGNMEITYRNGIHSLLRRVDARGIADIICHI